MRGRKEQHKYTNEHELHSLTELKYSSHPATYFKYFGFVNN